jgi:PAS domain S-box-containing protein
MSPPTQPDPPLDLRYLVDHLPSMLAYWDRELRCRFANRAYLDWFGIDPEKVIGMRLWELLGPELFALNEPYVRAVLRGRAQTFERMVPGPGGIRRHSLANYIPDGAEGEVRGFLVQVTEITMLKETQAALRQEQAVRAQMEIHASELRAILHERNEIIDVLAHEVRPPLHNALAALRGAVSALNSVDGAGGDPARQLTRAQEVMTEVLAHVDNTLAVASLFARPDRIEREDVDVDTLVQISIGDMPDEQRGRIRVERKSATRTAMMDMNLMRLALRNLLANALRYSPADSPVQIVLRDSDDPLALLIEVTNEGPGFEAELLPRLFQRGARGRAASRTTSHGLGLYLVRRVLELHGGHVELDDKSQGRTTLRMVVTQSR